MAPLKFDYSRTSNNMNKPYTFCSKVLDEFINQQRDARKIDAVQLKRAANAVHKRSDQPQKEKEKREHTEVDRADKMSFA